MKVTIMHPPPPSLCNTLLYVSPIALGPKLQEDSHSISKYCKLQSIINCVCILKQRQKSAYESSGPCGFTRQYKSSWMNIIASILQSYHTALNSPVHTYCYTTYWAGTGTGIQLSVFPQKTTLCPRSGHNPSLLDLEAFA